MTKKHPILGLVTLAGGLVAVRMSYVDGNGTWNSMLPIALGLTALGWYVYKKPTGPLLAWGGAGAGLFVCAGAYAICKEYGPCGR